MRYLSMLVVMIVCSAASACPFCAETIRHTDAQTASSVGGAMNISIYCMFVGFFVALGIVVRTLIKGLRG